MVNYTLKAGALYRQGCKLAYIRSAFSGPEKRIYSQDKALALRAKIQDLEFGINDEKTICSRHYILADRAGIECAAATPEYFAEDMFSTLCELECRMPCISYVQLLIGKIEYRLTVRNDQSYSLYLLSGETVIRMCHRGLLLGWDIEAAEEISPEMICGIFVLCRYIESENEFIIV